MEYLLIILLNTTALKKIEIKETGCNGIKELSRGRQENTQRLHKHILTSYTALRKHLKTTLSDRFPAHF